MPAGKAREEGGTPRGTREGAADEYLYVTAWLCLVMWMLPLPNPQVYRHGKNRAFMGKGRACFQSLSYLTFVFIHSFKKTFMSIINTSSSLHLMVDCINGPIFHPSFCLLPLMCNLAISFCEPSEIPILGLSHASFSIDQWAITRQSAGILVLLPLVRLPSS